MTGRIPITDVQPLVGCGRWPAKAVVGETFTVSATVFREGHDAVNANVVLRDAKGRKAAYVPMRKLPRRQRRARGPRAAPPTAGWPR
jgi:starch synthase (maltosyl-transferring)